MDKDKKISLNNYLTKLEDRLAAPVPPKHKNHIKTYHQFLQREIKMIKDVFEQERLHMEESKK